MNYLALYGGALAVFLPVDAVWIKFVMNPLFRSHVGALMTDRPQMAVAAGFYLLYVAGIVYFAVLPALKSGNWQLAALNGAILGALAYGTYEATNMATLRGWSWSMLALDVTWGIVLTALSALGGYAAGRMVGAA